MIVIGYRIDKIHADIGISLVRTTQNEMENNLLLLIAHRVAVMHCRRRGEKAFFHYEVEFSGVKSGNIYRMRLRSFVLVGDYGGLEPLLSALSRRVLVSHVCWCVEGGMIIKMDHKKECGIISRCINFKCQI